MILYCSIYYQQSKKDSADASIKSFGDGCNDKNKKLAAKEVCLI